MAETTTELERTMESLIQVFHRYSHGDGDGKTLSKKELKTLFEKELPTFLKAQKDPKTVDRMMKDLDQNKDNKVDFEEFVALIVGLTMACEKAYTLHENRGKK